MKLNLSLIGGIIVLLGLMIWGIISPKIRYLPSDSIIVTQREWDIRDSIANLPPKITIVHDTIIVKEEVPILSDPVIVYVDTTSDNKVIKYEDTFETEYFKVNLFDSIVNSVILSRYWTYEVYIPTETITIEKPYPVPYDVFVPQTVGGFFVGADLVIAPYNKDVTLLGTTNFITKKGDSFRLGAGITTGARLAIQIGYAKKIF